MKESRARGRRVEAVVGASFRQDLERAPTRVALDSARDDLVRILLRLTKDVERFESMVNDQRQLLQKHAAQPGAFDNDDIRHQSMRISVSAAELAASASGTLEELQRLSRVNEPAPLETYERQQYAGGHIDDPMPG